MSKRDPTKRFSDRVENYVKSRPGYPPAIVPFLAAECGLRPESVIADVGSGTGLLAEVWLRHGNPVFGVEPNAEMRAAGEQLLAGYPGFTSVPGTAEATTLPDGSVDFVTAGQAFHWFQPADAAREFARILRPPRPVVLVWNVRAVDASPFMAGYEQILQQYAPEYSLVGEMVIPSGIDVLFPGAAYRVQHFANRQVFDRAGLQSRLLSSSYAPPAGTPGYAPMLADLDRLFDDHAVDGHVVFEYDTQVIYGTVTGGA